MKEKIDRQLAGQSSSTPFMSIKDSYNKKVTFATQTGLEEKMDKLTVLMGKLATRDNGTNRQFKPQIYQSKRRGHSRNFYDTHIMIEEIIKIDIDQIEEIEEFSLVDKVEVDQGMSKIIGMIKGGNFRGNMKTYQNF